MQGTFRAIFQYVTKIRDFSSACAFGARDFVVLCRLEPRPRKGDFEWAIFVIVLFGVHRVYVTWLTKSNFSSARAFALAKLSYTLYAAGAPKKGRF